MANLKDYQGRYPANDTRHAQQKSLTVEPAPGDLGASFLKATMALGHRPTFLLELPEGPEAVARRLHAGLSVAEIETRWSRIPGASTETTKERTYVLLALPAGRRHFWSPWLHLDIRPADVGSELFGRYSPHPNVWTAFALGYLLLGAIIFLGSLFACAQIMLGRPSHAWWPVIVAAVVALTMWWSAQVGQRLARVQIEELDARLHSALSSSV